MTTKVQIIKAENSRTVRITSDVTPNQVKIAQAIDPKLTTLVDEDKKPVFVVTVGQNAFATVKGVQIPNGETINFTVDVNADDEVFKYTVASIASNLTKVLEKVEKLVADVEAAEVEEI